MDDDKARIGEACRASQLSRRQLMGITGGGLAAAVLGAVPGYVQGSRAPGAMRTAHLADQVFGPVAGPTLAGVAPVQSFVTRPDLRPPALTVTNYITSPSSPPYVFLSVRNYLAAAPSQAGLMIVDRLGRLVWFMPIPAAPFNFSAQSYEGRPVLTWWQGSLLYDYGTGADEIADDTYVTRHTVRAGDGLSADLHEFLLTSQGTALITAYQVVTGDLSSVGGSPKGQVIAGHAQEIDVATGKVLFDWDSLGQIGYSESYLSPPKSGPFDYFHINSVDEMPDGNFLVSARNTWALYKLDRANGKVLWRMNGKRSNWKMGPGTNFYWQHDARSLGPASISVFDDGYETFDKASQGLLLQLNSKTQEVTLSHAYRNSAGFIAGSQGNVQVLPNGHVFIGWGNQNYFSEFAADGTLVLDGQLPVGCHSYRAFCQEWSGQPSTPPDVSALANPPGGAVVYASWNGATAVARWVVLAGSSPSKLSEVGSQPRTGFETSIAVNSSGPYFVVVAEDAAGKQIGRSSTTKLASPFDL
ncbi:MAG: arylsulfotransferase family protein [Actinobacteria bacterium]|nr:arylsulfotransferase family protein [Actinomycetota bacterium]